jgi:hypothetical protein
LRSIADVKESLLKKVLKIDSIFTQLLYNDKMNTYRTFRIPVFKKCVKCITPYGTISKINHAKVIAYFGHYSVNIVSAENDEMTIEEFYSNNWVLMRALPHLFRNLFPIPVHHTIDKDVSQYLLDNNLFTNISFAYPACIYQVSPIL